MGIFLLAWLIHYRTWPKRKLNGIWLNSQSLSLIVCLMTPFSLPTIFTLSYKIVCCSFHTRSASLEELALFNIIFIPAHTNPQRPPCFTKVHSPTLTQKSVYYIFRTQFRTSIVTLPCLFIVYHKINILFQKI